MSDATQSVAPALARAMAEEAAALEILLDRLLPERPGPKARLHAAMRHGVLGGGKRLRPFLAVTTGRLFGADPADCRRAGAAIEFIHAYSLIHDDLPAMDDASLRRGRPACHKAFDEATAILAGDALQALGFDVLCDPDWQVPADIRSALAFELARAAGAEGMCGGQMLDLLAENRTLDLDAIGELQRLKTGAIIKAACAFGCILGRAEEDARRAIDAYAGALGLAFQVSDDLLDLTGDSKATGKDHGLDAAAGKATFVSILGESGARSELLRLRDAALAHLEPFGESAALLRQLFTFVITRTS